MDCIDLRDAVASLLHAHLRFVECRVYANYVAGATYSGSLTPDTPLYVVRIYPCEGGSVSGQGTTPEAALADFEANALPVLVERFAPKRSAEEVSAELNSLLMV